MSKLRTLPTIHLRWFSAKPTVKLDESLVSMTERPEFKLRHHPGILKLTFVKLPDWALASIRNVLQGNSLTYASLSCNARTLAEYLHNRRLPVERQQVHETMQIARARLSQEAKDEESNQDMSDKDILTTPKGRLLMSQLLYNWTAINYNKYNSLLYMVIRSAPEYAALSKIFYEISIADKDFQPNTLFDFGSGIGTVLWAAARYWSSSLNTHFCVDISTDITDLSVELAQYADPPIKGIFHRQFFPSSPYPTYDIVVSAFSFLDLPDMKARLATLSKLWQKTERYLVIVEHGTKAGFGIVCEARDFILNYAGKGAAQEANVRPVNIFSPCPHSFACPRHLKDDTPCNFTVGYETLPVFGHSTIKHEHYAYVVFKKGEQSQTNQEWPRIVREVLKRSGHVICRMCTAAGELDEVIFTKSKHGRQVYRMARCSKWGDRFPCTIAKVEGETEQRAEAAMDSDGETESAERSEDATFHTAEDEPLSVSKDVPTDRIKH